MTILALAALMPVATVSATTQTTTFSQTATFDNVKITVSGTITVDTTAKTLTGTISFTAKKPKPEEARHRELLDRLEQMTREIAQLRMREAPPTA